jgi:hypothetical protein
VSGLNAFSNACFQRPLIQSPTPNGCCRPCGAWGTARHDAQTSRRWSLTERPLIEQCTEPRGTVDQALYKQLMPSLCARLAQTYRCGDTHHLGHHTS